MLFHCRNENVEDNDDNKYENQCHHSIQLKITKMNYNPISIDIQ